MYHLIIRNNPKKFLDKLQGDQIRRFSVAIHKLAENPLIGDVKKLRGDVPNAYRLRIGKWRVLFRKNDDDRTLDIVIIDKRGDIY
ncbi:MAG: type II toxin-antitoxin system RelE/ParE family toxin [Patescibacteria group bacterium]